MLTQAQEPLESPQSLSILESLVPELWDAWSGAWLIVGLTHGGQQVENEPVVDTTQHLFDAPIGTAFPNLKSLCECLLAQLLLLEERISTYPGRQFVWRVAAQQLLVRHTAHRVDHDHCAATSCIV